MSYHSAMNRLTHSIRFGVVHLILVTVAWLAGGGPRLAFAQGTQADYDRAGRLARLTQDKVFKFVIKAHWLAGNDKFWYRVDLPGGAREFVLVDAAAGKRMPAFDHARLAAALSKAAGTNFPADHLPIDSLDFPDAGRSVILRCEGKAWRCSLADYTVQPDKAPPVAAASLPAVPRASRPSDHETFITFVNRTGRPVELFWLDTDGKRQSYGRIALGATHEQHTFAGHVWLACDARGAVLGVFEGKEEATTATIEVADIRGTPPPPPAAPGRRGTSPRRSTGPRSGDGQYEAFFRDNNVFLRELPGGKEHALTTDGAAADAYGGECFWSGDSAHLVVYRTKKGDDRRVQYIESSPKDQLQPKLHEYHYLKPGDRVPQRRPALFDAALRRRIPISEDLFPNPYELGGLRWEADSKSFTFNYNQRGHQVFRVLSVDAGTGQVRPIIDEPCRTFFDYVDKFFLHRLEGTGEILWMSERDGWNHLYLYDARTGQVKNQVTKGAWVVRGVERVDQEKRQVWLRCGGIIPGQDPYYIHYARVNLDGTGLTVLTAGDGTHKVEFSPDGRFFLDTCSRVDLPPVHELRRSDDGKLVCELERADASALLQAGWKAPERFAAKGRDGQTDIYGVIFKPTTFDPARRYPVIEEIYAGPQDSFVPKSFRAFHSAQALAELGFVTVKIDGMGTSNRSKKFHDVCWKNLGDAGLPDRVLWMKAAAAGRPWMDISRVGVYGGSAGGQSAMRALITHGDFYKAAVADCGCHDNRMDKIWWNELWMGWPIGPHYAEQSNVTQAHRLRGKLLLIVGEMDENVDPASTMQVASALVQADKDFELLIIPGRGHGAGGSPYGRRRTWDFFVRNLLGAEPRAK